VFSEVAGYKINLQNQFHFYTLTGNYLEKIKKTTPFIIASKTIKHRNKFNQENERPIIYTENRKILMKEIEDTQIMERYPKFMK